MAPPKKRTGRLLLVISLSVGIPVVLVVSVIAIFINHATTDTTVTYAVTGDVSKAGTGYIDHSKVSTGDVITSESTILPFSVDTTARTGQYLEVYAVPKSGGLVTCTITVNGHVLATDTGVGSTGAKCVASMP